MMVAQWMVYSLLTAVLVSAAALAMEAWFRSTGRAVRWVWAAAPVVSLFVPALALLTGGRYPGVLVPWVGSAGSWSGILPRIESGVVSATATPGVLERFNSLLLSDGVLVAFWLLATLAAAAWYVGVWRRISRSSRTWRHARVAGSAVRVSRDGGPAAVGLIRPWIVVPEWLLEASETSQRVVLRHELEHVRTRDHALLAVAPLLVILFPWNLVLWWQVRRLRLAVELDCDRRVLASGVDVETYASLLLQIAARPRGHVLAVSLVPAERRPLEIRLKAMTRGPLRWRRLRVFGSMVAAGLLLAVACETDPPLVPALDAAAGNALLGGGAAWRLDEQFAGIADDVESGRVQAFVDGERVSREELDLLVPERIASIEVMKGAFGATDPGNTRLISGRIYIRTKSAVGSAGVDGAQGGVLLRPVGEEPTGGMWAERVSPLNADGRLTQLMESADPLASLPADAEWFLDGRPVTRSEVSALRRDGIGRIEVVKQRINGADAPPQVRVFTKGGDGG